MERIGTDGQEAIQSLLKIIFSNEGAYTRSIALKIILKNRPTAKDMMPILTRLLDDKEYEMQVYAANEIGEYGPEANEAVPELIRAIKMGSPNLASSAIESLGKIGPSAEERISEIEKAIETFETVELRNDLFEELKKAFKK